MQTQEYLLKRRLLDEYVDQLLLDDEAKRRGIDTERLLRTEVTEKARPIADPEVRTYYEAVQERFGAMPEASGRDRRVEARGRELRHWRDAGPVHQRPVRRWLRAVRRTGANDR
jgi:hypothetical protein